MPLFTQKIKPQHFGSQKIKTWHFYVPHAQPVQTPCHVKIKPWCLKYIFVKIKPWCLKMYFFILTSTLSYFWLLVWRTPPGPWSRGSVFGHIDDSQFCFSVADMLNFCVRFGNFILNIRDKERYDPPGSYTHVLQKDMDVMKNGRIKTLSTSWKNELHYNLFFFFIPVFFLFCRTKPWFQV